MGAVLQPWTDEEIERLKALWAAPDANARTIGRELRRTKNSVISKIHQQGLQRPRGSNQTRNPRPKRSPKMARMYAVPNTAPASSYVPRPVMLPPTCRRVSLMDKTGCCYPVEGEGAATLFCDNGKAHESYCEYHQRVTHNA